MENLGRTLVLLGLALAAVGAGLWLFGRLGLKALPGDLKYESENVRFYFPLGTSILLSVMLTLGFWVWRHFQGK